MIVRRARPDELDAVGELTVAAYVADGLIEPEHAYVETLRAAARRDAAAELVVAVDRTGHELLGTVTFCQYGSDYAEISLPGEAEFRMLGVAPAARGRGVGHALARWCLDRAREQGCTALVLSTHEDMWAAHRLYARMGFTRLSDRDWEPYPGTKLMAFSLELVP